jgi:hypothetical protein
LKWDKLAFQSSYQKFSQWIKSNFL